MEVKIHPAAVTGLTDITQGIVWYQGTFFLRPWDTQVQKEVKPISGHLLMDTFDVSHTFPFNSMQI